MSEEANCEFYVSGWNDQEQRNYIIYECNNQRNIGGKASFDKDDSRASLDVFHGSRMYSCWHKNKGMAFRCFGEPEKMKECPLVKKVQPQKVIFEDH